MRNVQRRRGQVQCVKCKKPPNFDGPNWCVWREGKCQSNVGMSPCPRPGESAQERRTTQGTFDYCERVNHFYDGASGADVGRRTIPRTSSDLDMTSDIIVVCARDVIDTATTILAGEDVAPEDDACKANNGGCSDLVSCTPGVGGVVHCGACPQGYSGNGVVSSPASDTGAWFIARGHTLVPIRPRRRGERRSLRNLPCVSLRSRLAFNPRPRRLSTPTDAFQLHPDITAPANGCADVNECSEDNGGCGDSVACVNTEGGRVCGASTSGGECFVNYGGCDPLTTCSDPDDDATNGNAQCGVCPSGYYSLASGKCARDDACASSPCSAGTTCTPDAPPGVSYTCVDACVGGECGGKCPQGMKGDGQTCTARSIHWSPYDRVRVVNADP